MKVKNMNYKKKILFTTPVLEHPPAGGPQLRIENSVKALSKVSELHLISRVSRRNIGGMESESFYKSNCHNFIYSPSARQIQIGLFGKLMSYRFDIKNKKVNRIINIPFKIIDRVIKKIINYDHADTSIENDAEFIKQYVLQNRIDILWFGYGNISYQLMKSLKEMIPDIKMVCDTDSVWSRFVLRELPYEKDPARRDRIERDGRLKEQEESKWVEFCDVTTAVSEVDAHYYRGLTRNPSKIMLFSNVIDLESYKKIENKPIGLQNPSIYLAGSFGPKSPMDKAARWFLADIYPIIKKEVPNIHFYIIGTGSKETLNDITDRSITVLGKVASVLPYLQHIDVSIVPLQFESGTRFKIMEAAACKKPIVSTTLGAEGIPVKNGRHLLIADTPQSFAEAVIKLLKNDLLSKKIANECHKLISQSYSIKSLTLEALSIIERLS